APGDAAGAAGVRPAGRAVANPVRGAGAGGRAAAGAAARRPAAAADAALAEARAGQHHRAAVAAGVLGHSSAGRVAAGGGRGRRGVGVWRAGMSGGVCAPGAGWGLAWWRVPFARGPGGGVGWQPLQPPACLPAWLPVRAKRAAYRLLVALCLDPLLAGPIN